MTETDLSYIAGIIDGEGNIAIQQIQALCVKKRETSKRYNAYVRVYNTDKRLLEWLCQKAGFGKINVHSPKTKRSRTCYSTRLISKKAEALLREIYPYLVIKKEQAKVFFDFMETYKTGWAMKHGLPPEISVKRNNCYVVLKKLHHREF